MKSFACSPRVSPPRSSPAIFASALKPSARTAPACSKNSACSQRLNSSAMPSRTAWWSESPDAGAVQISTGEVTSRQGYKAMSEEAKFQTPNLKSQTNPKLQVPSFKGEDGVVIAGIFHISLVPRGLPREGRTGGNLRKCRHEASFGAGRFCRGCGTSTRPAPPRPVRGRRAERFGQHRVYRRGGHSRLLESPAQARVS